MPPSIVPPGGGASDRKPATRRTDDEDIRPYVLTGELGKGSFATVYKGFNEVRLPCPSSRRKPHRLPQNTKEQVAIKTVSRHGLSSKLFDNLQSEIDILKSLSHRHITKLIDIVVRLSLLPL